jgi:hypothetical protein
MNLASGLKKSLLFGEGKGSTDPPGFFMEEGMAKKTQ